MLTFEVVDSADHLLVASAREMFEEYARELNVDLCFQGFSDELAALPGKYGPPRGILILVMDGDVAAACGAMRELDDNTCEMKRIYVRPAYRGAGLGRQITLDLMDRARGFGYTMVRLDSLRRLGPAVKMYESLGYREISPYSFNPGLDIVYFERGL